MRHQTENIAFFVAYAGYVVEAAIRVSWISAVCCFSVFVAVAEHKHVFVYYPSRGDYPGREEDVLETFSKTKQKAVGELP